MPEPTAPPAPAFDLTPDQQATLDGADEYARLELYPLAARMDAEEWWPAEAFAKLGRNGYLGATVPGSLRRRGRGPVHERPRAAGDLALEPCARAGLGRARQPVRQQHLPQRQRGAAPALPPRPVLGQARRRPGTHRAGRRLRCAGLDAHHRPARGRSLPAQRLQALHHQWAGGRCAAGLCQDRARARPAGHLGVHRGEGLRGLQGRAEAHQDGLPRQPDRGTRPSPTAGCRRPTWSAPKTAGSRS